MIALYARVSTLLQASDGTSLNTQIELCLKKAKELGYKEHQIEIFREEGFTGEDIERPQMNRLREMIAEGYISTVIITHPDRLSRDMVDKLIVMREWEKNGAELIFTDTEYNNTPEGMLFFNILSAIAQYELALIKKRTIRGRLHAVEKHNKVMPMRVPPYGYDFVESQLVINKEEAKFVEKIYHWYLNDKMTMREIGNRLYEEGAVPKRGESKNFGASSIQRILSSEIYIGKYTYNRRKTQKVKGEKTDNGNPKKIYEIRDKEDWITIDVPAIIDIKLFNEVKKQREKNLTKGGNVKHNYLLKSLIRCACCGRTWDCTTYNGKEDKRTGIKQTYPIYRCPNRNPKKYGEGIKKCPSKTIRTELLDKYIWDLLIETVTSPEIFMQRLEDKRDVINNDFEEELENLKGQLFIKQKAREKVKKMFYDELTTAEEMKEDMEKFNKEITIIQKRVEQIENQMVYQKENEINIERIQKFVEGISPMVESEHLTFEEKKYIIETLIDEIKIDYREEENVVVTVSGVLDDLLKLKERKYLISCSQHQEVRKYRGG